MHLSSQSLYEFCSCWNVSSLLIIYSSSYNCISTTFIQLLNKYYFSLVSVLQSYTHTIYLQHNIKDIIYKLEHLNNSQFYNIYYWWNKLVNNSNYSNPLFKINYYKPSTNNSFQSYKKNENLPPDEIFIIENFDRTSIWRQKNWIILKIAYIADLNITLQKCLREDDWIWREGETCRKWSIMDLRCLEGAYEISSFLWRTNVVSIAFQNTKEKWAKISIEWLIFHERTREQCISFIVINHHHLMRICNCSKVIYLHIRYISW